MHIAEQLFTQFCEGYKKRDLPFILSLCTKDSNMWGSGLDEYRKGSQEITMQLQRDWSQSEHSEIEIVQFTPTAQDGTWTAAICNAHVVIDGTKHTFQHLRGTLIAEKEEGIWKIAHTHCSFPDYRNAENDSFPVNG
jgi:ketosteroid isomerase-like protein